MYFDRTFVQIKSFFNQGICLLRNVSSTKESVYSEILLQPTNLFTQESFFNQGICLLRNPSTQEYFFNKRICLLRNLSSDKEYVWRLLRNPPSNKESVYVGILLQPRNLFTRAFFFNCCQIVHESMYPFICVL